jgi:hypothetical protein
MGCLHVRLVVLLRIARYLPATAGSAASGRVR